jgi:ribulose-phosphate 3-epimerase
VLADPGPLLRSIRARGKKVGLAINPETPVEVMQTSIGEIDVALCMTVHPGFGGQPFLPESLQRIRMLRQMIDRLNPVCELEVDGGIDWQTAPLALAAGATVFVAGSAVFSHPEGPGAAVTSLLSLIRRQ